ncbi:MAG: molybdate ABC transporter substrate-binding protein, partial [Spirochaetia bacterium]|nr:molybdate ABC transporter substrate-binding protein [Spirochaetia bacterium]
MRPHITFFFLAATTAFLESQPVELNVSAAASLRPALEEIKPIFETSQKNTPVVYNFGSSGALSQQILNGAKVDVFLSANPKQVHSLAKAGLVRSHEIKIILKNSLVLIVPKGSLFIKNTSDLSGKKIFKIALGEP